ncbi:MAG: SDR family oxidoreductase [Candidatus Heimdallarchaeota archaeon]|nr:SDR family oxidoreductase [Candidatus Heimdallarchaeota archaeon]
MKQVFITGASRGLGLEFAKQYLERGEKVFASCRNPEDATLLQKLKESYKDNLQIIKLDVSDEEARNSVFEKVSRNTESLDILINNAGIISGNEQQSSVLGDVYKEDFNKVFLVNSISPLLVTERFLPLLEKGSTPKIVNISSQNGSISQRNSGGKYSYASSKAALNMITKILSHDIKDKGITALSIHPGWIKTDMGGEEAPLEIEKPISQIISLIDSKDISESGKFLDREGNEMPW